MQGLLALLALASPAIAVTPPPCATAGSGWCLARRFVGDTPEGEFGFRFGEPLDVDGDGRADIAAGSRFKRQGSNLSGRVTVWSGAGGALLQAWDGDAEQSGFFGHWVLPTADIDGDRLADLIISAPSARVHGEQCGVVAARSPKTGKEIWRSVGWPDANFGWDLALAGDHDRDGHSEIFVGQPASRVGRVFLLAGKDGQVLRVFEPAEPMGSFGWFVARTDDFDGDGLPDLAVGAQPQHGPDDPPGGAAYVVSSASGKELQKWKGTDSSTGFGEVVAAVGDLDGDGHGEVVVASPGTNDRSRSRPGVIRIYAGKTWKELRTLSGTQPGELYGRMVVAVGDLDGDHLEDLAIGAPWHRREGGDRVGRVELRSGGSGALIAEFFGEGPESWFGWHIRRAADPDGRGRPSLLIGSLRQPANGAGGVGVIDWYVLQQSAAAHGTIKRGARRSDIK